MNQPLPQRSSRCKHGYVVCAQCVAVTDDARRMSDALSLLLVSHPWDTICNTWVAISLQDGSVNTTLYDSWQDAADRYDSRHYAIFAMRNALGGCPARDCQLFLNMRRHVSSQGGSWTAPAETHILSVRSHDILTGRVNPRAN